MLASPDVRTARSVRFALWNNEETGLNGARAYVEQRASLQGIEDPDGSGRYPEPTWLGMIQHDMMMWDHGNPVTHEQALDADVDIEFQLASEKAPESAALALALLNSNRMFATDYPAVVSNAMSNTDSSAFQDLVAAVSLRENRRLYETGNGANPHWHQPTDLYVTFSDAGLPTGLQRGPDDARGRGEARGRTHRGRTLGLLLRVLAPRGAPLRRPPAAPGACPRRTEVPRPSGTVRDPSAPAGRPGS